MTTTTRIYRSDIMLSDEQQRAVETITGSEERVQTLGGYAGTGKTTVIGVLREQLRGYTVCAYTGKAADVLRRKGIEASTIHSLIYRPVVDEVGRVVEPVEFELIPRWEFPHKGIIVDEASMVGKAIYDDLLTFKVPLVFVGDHGQLEPVGDSGFNLMESPGVVLETVHRNAGPIAVFAEGLRLGMDARCAWERAESGTGGDGVSIETFDTVGRLDINRNWQLICAYNRTRCGLNAMVREHIGMPVGVPSVGDRVMCLQNSKVYKLFNGMQGTIEEIDYSKESLKFSSEQGVNVRVPYEPTAFGSVTKPEYSRSAVPFDWAYCVTCHKAQGDEFENVCVIEQRCGAWDHRRWTYTAASRAKRKLVWIVG